MKANHVFLSETRNPEVGSTRVFRLSPCGSGAGSGEMWVRCFCPRFKIGKGWESLKDCLAHNATRKTGKHKVSSQCDFR